MAIHIRGETEKEIRDIALKFSIENGIKLSAPNCLRMMVADFNKHYDNAINDIIEDNVKPIYPKIKKITKKIVDEKYFQNYYRDNKIEIDKQHKEYVRNKRRTNISFKIRCNLATRIWSALRDQSGSKHTNTMSYVGCALEQFKHHLEVQFKPDMNWDNYGTVWSIDHCVPCSHYDLTKLEQQKECFHYTNMKPMYIKDNIIKSNRYTEPKILDTL